MTFLQLMNVGLLAASLVALVIMIDHMNLKTRLSIKISAVVCFVGVLAEIFGYFKGWSEWTDTLFFGGMAMCLLSNLRGPMGAISEKISDRNAYIVGTFTIATVLVSWARG